MPTFAELRKLTEEELVARFDAGYGVMKEPTPDLVGRTTLDPELYLHELHRREESAQTERIVALTQKVETLTQVMTALTVVIAGATLWQVAKDSGAQAPMIVVLLVVCALLLSAGSLLSKRWLLRKR